MAGPAWLGAGDVDSLFTPRDIVSYIRRVLSDPGSVEAPRASLEHAGSWLGLMGAGGYGRFVVKVVGVYPGNPSRGLPLVRGVLEVYDAETGDPLLFMDAGPPTGWRTAGATALALELLGYRGGGVLGLIGAGFQARYHARVLGEIYRPEELLVYDVDPTRASSLAREFGGVVSGLEDLLSRADVIVAATTSREPVVRGRLRDGVFVASIGAPRPVRELDDSVVADAGCVLTDSPIAWEETDDMSAAREIVTMRDVLLGRAECRPGRIRVYKGVGTPLLDLAAGLLVEARFRGPG